MALVCAQIASNMIQLLGCWQADAMLAYLHVQAQPVLHQFVQSMLLHGSIMHSSAPATL
jgi:hypothetical protein